MGIDELMNELVSQLGQLDGDALIEKINQLKIQLHAASPFSQEPVDCVIWVKSNSVRANDYNPNSVAPPEMRLLEHSIQQDGYTQPVVTWTNEVVDGFHRTRVGKESKLVRERTMGYLPVVALRESQGGRNDRMAATIRHNRARGKHGVDNMSEIIVELSKRNWSDKRIGKELGMAPDEVLRLKQISGLAELFADKEFGEAWEVDYSSTD